MDSKKIKVLFVCLGNICRSPAAEAVFNHKIKQAGLADQFIIDSAGTSGAHAGEKADARMRAAALKRGIEVTSLSRKFIPQDFDQFDKIVVMDDRNYHDVCKLAHTDDDLKKVVKMVKFCHKHTDDHISDPYYGGVEGFNYVLDLLDDACGGLLELVVTR
jgi:protein-tyrosine phosphatase